MYASDDFHSIPKNVTLYSRFHTHSLQLLRTTKTLPMAADIVKKSLQMNSLKFNSEIMYKTNKILIPKISIHSTNRKDRVFYVLSGFKISHYFLILPKQTKIHYISQGLIASL